MAGGSDPARPGQDSSGATEPGARGRAPEEATTSPVPMRGVPALPRRLAEPTPVVLAGTALWFVGAALFAVTPWDAGLHDVRFWTCVTGGVLGVIGYGVFRWQRSASRRGSRGAWKGLAGLDE